MTNSLGLKTVTHLQVQLSLFPAREIKVTDTIYVNILSSDQ